MAFDNDLSTTLMKDIEAYYDISVVTGILSSHCCRHQVLDSNLTSISVSDCMSQIDLGNCFVGVIIRK